MIIKNESEYLRGIADNKKGLTPAQGMTDAYYQGWEHGQNRSNKIIGNFFDQFDQCFNEIFGLGKV